MVGPGSGAPCCWQDFIDPLIRTRQMCQPRREPMSRLMYGLARKHAGHGSKSCVFSTVRLASTAGALVVLLLALAPLPRGLFFCSVLFALARHHSRVSCRYDRDPRAIMIPISRKIMMSLECSITKAIMEFTLTVAPSDFFSTARTENINTTGAQM